jgi:hypothetical protein
LQATVADYESTEAHTSPSEKTIRLLQSTIIQQGWRIVKGLVTHCPE